MKKVNQDSTNLIAAGAMFVAAPTILSVGQKVADKAMSKLGLETDEQYLNRRKAEAEWKNDPENPTNKK